MRKIILSPALLFVLIFNLPAVAQKTKTNNTPSKPVPQVFDGRLEMRVLGIEKVDEWLMFPSNPMGPKVTAKDGQELIVVRFEVKNLKDRKIDEDENFKDFEFEDQESNKYKSYLKATDLREIPFAVKPGARPKTFGINGLTFDVSQLTIKRRAPRPN